MFHGKYIFNQIISFLSQHAFNQCVEKFDGNHRIKTFTCWQHFLVMAFGQLGKRESLRDVCICLTAHQAKLYHLGFSRTVQRATLQDANENRDYHIYESFAYTLIAKARMLYLDDTAFTLKLEGAAYALDSTTIDLCLSLFPWARFRTTKSGVKAHVLLDLEGNIPSFVAITEANISDVTILDVLTFEAGAIVVMDRGYLDFSRLYVIHTAKAYFVTRAKHNTKMRRLYSSAVTDEEWAAGIRCDQMVVFTGSVAKKNYPEQLRRVKYYDAETKNYYVFLTNNFTLPALTIAELYRKRWQVELFFKWMKQHLQIQSFWGRSENAVKTQIWIAVATYTLVAIVKKKLELPQSMHEILQILSISLFDKTPLKQLFSEYSNPNENADSEKQLKLLDF